MTIFKFPTIGIDEFTPVLINDVSVVNANHVLDLRSAIEEIEKALIGSTPFPYNSTSIVISGDNLKIAIEKLDQHLSAVEAELGFIFDGYSYDGYAGRIDWLEHTLSSHRSESYQTDADGYSVHGVVGHVVGTENQQVVINKVIDSGTWYVGPKFITRSNLSDSGNRQVEIWGANGKLNAWIDEQGDAYFAGDLVVEGDRRLRGIDVIENSLTTYGNSIFGDDTSIDTTTINGQLIINGTSTSLVISRNGDITSTGSNITLGNDLGLLDLKFLNINTDANIQTTGNISADGNLVLGLNGSTHTIIGSIQQLSGNIYTAGNLRVLGSKVSIENDTTTINTNSLIIGSSVLQLGEITLEGDTGNIASDGYQFTFGNLATKSTNLFSIYGNTTIDGNAVISELLNVDEIQTNLVETLNINTNLLTISTGAIPGKVWTCENLSGDGYWADIPSLYQWDTIVTDGYYIQSLDGYQLNPTPGFYNTSHREEIFCNTISGMFVVNLPNNPNFGDRIRFADFNGSWNDTNYVLVYPQSTGIVRDFDTTKISIINNEIEYQNHGLIPGQRGILTTTGTLPGGLNLPYVYVIVHGWNKIKFAQSLENAIADIPIPINITSVGTGVHTFTTGTIMGSGFLELDVDNGWAEVVFNGATWRVITS